MIGSLRGTLLHRIPGHVLLEVQGVGYEISIPIALYDQLPAIGEEVRLFVVESMAMYGGGTTLYGFSSVEEKDIYLLLREVPGTGSKKALDYLDKISKSLPDFRRAILESDSRALTSLFGFTKKTTDKMIAALKERFSSVRISGKEKWTTVVQAQEVAEAVAALIQLGYREPEARAALDRIPPSQRVNAVTGDLIREALKQLV